MTRTFRIPLDGRGTAELPAFGMNDAEARVEKELTRYLPDARVAVLHISRPDAAERIVEEFRVEYRVRCSLEAEGESADSATTAALRAVRERLRGSRFHRIEWQLPRATPEPIEPA